MSKNTTDEQMKHYNKIIEQFDSVHMPAKQREIIMTEIEQLISSREKMLLDRVEKEVLSDVELRADQTDVIDDIEDWLQGGGIAPSYDYGRIHCLANERHKVLRRKLATLRKELDGGDHAK